MIMKNPKELLPLIAEMHAIMDRFKALGDLPTHLIVPPGPDFRAVEARFPAGELAGIKIIVSEHVPPGTAYLVTDPPKDANLIELDEWWHKLPLRSQKLVNLDVP